MILFGIVFVILAIFAFYKYRKKIALIGIALCIVGVGISYIRFDFKQEVYSGMVIDSHTNYFILLSKGEKLYAYSKENEYEIRSFVEKIGYFLRVLLEKVCQILPFFQFRFWTLHFRG